MSINKVAVIGGSGFIGTRLVQSLLRSGYSVRIIDKVQSEAHPGLWSFGDVRSPAEIVEGCRGCDVIYNLAAEHADNVRPVSLYDEVNVGGASNVCAAADTLGIKRLIFTSSVAVYGFSEQEQNEDTVPRPVNEYGRTKLEAEKVYLDWSAADASRLLTIVRPTVVFGEANRGNVYNLLNQIAKGYFLMVGDGSNRKSVAYVGNIVDFLEYLLAHQERDGVFNYADKPDLDMMHMVQLVKETLNSGGGLGFRLPYGIVYAVAGVLDFISAVTGASFPISRVRIAKFCANTCFSTERMLQTGFRPSVELVDALQQTIRAEFGAGFETDREPSVP